MNLDEGDWSYVFAYSSGESRGNSDVNTPKCVEGAACEPTPFDEKDVAHVLDASEGEGDSRDWLIAGVLNDGRFFFISAGCDYTGWGCQDWGTSWVSDTLGQLARFGLTDEARERLPGVAAALAQGVWT